MMQEWLDAILTVEWLLGASMALAGRRLLMWAEAVRESFSGSDEKGKEASQRVEEMDKSE